MAGKDFNVSVSTISGGSTGNILKLFLSNKVERKYKIRAFNSMAFSLLGEPFRLWEHLRYDGLIKQYEIKEPPVFIIGHWRSGTTHLHNLLCKDPQVGFVTTYQGVFPELLLGSEWLFKTMMKIMMPEKRASDNVQLSADFPQEEEFALGNMNPYGYYNFWFFPKKTKTFYRQNIRFEGAGEKVIQHWKNDYLRLVKKALIHSGKKRFVSKNPPHTGRIEHLLDLFPDARFIHIYRNPVTVFISTKKLIQSTIHPLQFQDISDDEIEENIFWVYEKMMQDYLKDRARIPQANLVEIRFEDFEKNTLGELEKIYAQIGLPGFESVKPVFKQYLESQKSYKKNKYTISPSLADTIMNRWKFAMDEWNYSLPENLEIR